MEFHHIGIPTTVQQSEENYMEGAKLFVTDPDKSDMHIEWLRFEEGSPLPEILKSEAHIAYKVENVEQAMAGKECLLEPFDAAPGVRVGFILEEGRPIEFLSIDAA